jgi:hypothetical protein
MTSRNAYSTLADYKAYVTARGQTTTTDATDDVVIDGLLDSASRFIDDETGRVFYPYVQTRYYDVPDSRELCLDEDLLEVLALVNGDGTTITSSDYFLVPKNIYPAYAIKLNDISSFLWTLSNLSSMENAISVDAIWAFRQNYSRDGWKVGTTTTEALDLTETEFDVTASTLFSAGQIIRYGNELGIVSSTASGKINVVSRGDNGSTAAAHDSGITVYIWQPEQGAKNAVLEMANSAYNRRFGNSTSGAVTITAAGVVISPRDITATAQAFIEGHKDKI